MCKKSALAGPGVAGSERAAGLRTPSEADPVRGQVTRPARTPGGVKGGGAGCTKKGNRCLKGPAIRGPFPQVGGQLLGSLGLLPSHAHTQSRVQGLRDGGPWRQLLGMSPSLPPSRNMGVGNPARFRGMGRVPGHLAASLPQFLPHQDASSWGPGQVPSRDWVVGEGIGAVG